MFEMIFSGVRFKLNTINVYLALSKEFLSGSGNEALAEAFVRIRNGEEVPAIAKVLVEVYVGRWRK